MPNMGPDDYCEHGVHVERFCMLCCRAGEGKPTTSTTSDGMCHVCDEPYSIEHQDCGTRDPQDC